MQISSATYEHTTIGFPGVVLKWHYDKATGHSAPYVVELHIIRGWNFREHFRPHDAGDLRAELERFDSMVRQRYADRPEVQG